MRRRNQTAGAESPGKLENNMNMTTLKYITNLQSENEKLRAALEKAAKVLALGFNPDGDEDTILMLRSTLQHAANECAGALAKEIAP